MSAYENKCHKNLSMKPESKPGYRFGIAAVAPGLLTAGAILTGAPFVSSVAAGAAAVLGFVFATIGFTGIAVTGILASLGCIAAYASNAVTVAGISGYLSVSALAASTGSLFAPADKDLSVGYLFNRVSKYDPIKVLAGILSGSVIGATVAYGAALSKIPCYKISDETSSPSTFVRRHLGGALCRDFKLSNASKSEVPAEAANKHIQTMPGGYVP